MCLKKIQGVWESVWEKLMKALEKKKKKKAYEGTRLENNIKTKI
jgi:hypothetical protein